MRLSAFSLLGGMIFSAGTGCNSHRMVECTPEEADYIKAGTDWSVANARAIDGSMTVTSEATARDIASALAGAELNCGVPASEHGENANASRRAGTKKLIVNVEHPVFQESINNFRSVEWVGEMSETELVELALKDPYAYSDVYYYKTSLAIMAFFLEHEAAHLVLGGHSPQVQAEVDELNTAGAASTDPGYRKLDDIYAWGFAALDAGDAEFEEFETEYQTASSSSQP